MIEAIDKIFEYTKGMNFEKFNQDDKIIDACLMQFQHLGETANKLKTHFPEENSIPYAEVVGFRNFIAHEYLGIDIDIVWNTVSKHLPLLKRKIETVLHTK